MKNKKEKYQIKSKNVKVGTELAVYMSIKQKEKIYYMEGTHYEGWRIKRHQSR